MLNAFKVKKVYKYLEKRMFSLETISPNIVELLNDDSVLNKLNTLLFQEQKIYRTKDLVIARINVVTKVTNDRTFYSPNPKCYAILKSLTKNEVNEKINKGIIDKNIYYEAKDSYYWLSKQNTIIHKLYPEYCRTNDLYISAVRPFAMLHNYDFITLESINKIEKRINKKQNINTKYNGRL